MFEKSTNRKNKVSILSILFVIYTGGLIALNTWYIYLQVKVNDYLVYNGLTQENPTGSWVLTNITEVDRIHEIELFMVDLRRYIFYFCIIFLIGSILLFLKKNSLAFSLYVFFSAYILGSVLYYIAIRLGFVYPSEFNLQFVFLDHYAMPFLIILCSIHFAKWFYLNRRMH